MESIGTHMSLGGDVPPKLQVFSQLYPPASNLTQHYGTLVVEVRTDVPGQFKGPGYGPIHQWKMA